MSGGIVTVGTAAACVATATGTTKAPAMSEWRPEGAPRAVVGPAGEVTLIYLRGSGGVGAHEVRFSDGKTLTMLPDAATTARKRTGAVSVALGEDHSLLAAIIGELVLAGATNLLLDGEPLLDREPLGRWVVELSQHGMVTMDYVAEVDETTADAG